MSSFTCNVAIVANEALSRDRIFEPTVARDNVLERFKLLREELDRQGIACRTVDMFEPGDVDVLIFHDIMNELRVILGIVKANPGVRLICLPNEPVFVLPLHDEIILPKLPVDQLLTWNDRIVGQYAHVKKLNIGQPVIAEQNIPRIPFVEKKFVSSIFAYKPAGGAGSIFDERLKAIEFFSQQPRGVDLFGVGWEAANLPFVESVYRGRCESKIEILQQYKFSVTFENSDAFMGLITEKIFDCFAAGTVPIYLGAPNVSDYIPNDCFINFRDFSNYSELYNYLVDMPEERYQAYLDAVKRFLNTPQYNQFTSTCYAETMRRQIEDVILTDGRRSVLSFKWILLKLIFSYPTVLANWRPFRRFLTTMLVTW